MAAIPVFLNGESSDDGDGGGRGRERIDDDISSSAILPMMDMFEDDDPEEDDMLVDNSLQMTKPTKNLFSLIEKIDAEQQTEDDDGYGSNVNGEGVGGGGVVLIQECTKCQTLEQDNQKQITQITSKYETEIARLRKELETANKAKETTVMRYAKSENEVIKLKRDIENLTKTTGGLMKEIETLNKKQKMLSSERERLGNIVDGKNCEIQSMQKDAEKLKEEMSAKDFKIKWTQNKLNAEMESHKDTQTRLQNLEEELEKMKESVAASISSSENTSADVHQENNASSSFPPALESNGNFNGSSSDEGIDSSESLSQATEKTNIIISSSLSITLKELEAVKVRNHQLVEENNQLSCKVQNLERQRLDLEQKQARLQESNSEHLHQIATLQSELAATESIKSQLQREQDAVLALQNDCQQLRQNHADALADMAVCRSKEAELLEYTQKVTEKNVTLQSEFSSVQAKSFALEEENERLQRQIEQLQIDMKNLEKMMSQECKNYVEERLSVENDTERQKKEIAELQRQLDEARGEIGLLHKNLNSKIRELSRELQVARRNMKDGASGSDGMSQSSRASSSSSLNNIDTSSASLSKQKQNDDIPEKPNEPDTPVIPDQQLLIERIVKLQRNLAKKQEKIEFLQEHVKQLTETLQKKSKIIISYAMNQDVEALSTELSEQNKLELEKLYPAEVVKYGGIMASVYGSKPCDDGLTLDLSLEINRKLQIVLEDTLLKNITLKDSLNTLGKEISKLTALNDELSEKLSRNANPG